MRRAAILLLVSCLGAGVHLAAQAPASADRSRPPAVQAGAARTSAALTPDQMERFLLRADVVNSRLIGKGVTSPWRLTLSDGALTQDAAFQSIDREKDNVRFRGGRSERQFRDYYGYNIAAWKLAQLLGYHDLVPVSVERTWRGSKGALTWWVNKKWDEDERLKEGIEPPDRLAWERQIYLARVFTALVEDTDRNLGNQLVTADFHLWMIDFTRAFRRSTTIDKPAYLRKIDRQLFERLKALEPRQIADALSPHVRREELAALIERQKAIIGHYEKAIAERGEPDVLY
jgi:hypothetical protein